MWKRLRRALRRVWRRSQRGPGECREAEARARFWAEVREGEREAEAQSRP
jgi:chromosome condensin MukBEF MukE localization factor